MFMNRGNKVHVLRKPSTSNTIRLYTLETFLVDVTFLVYLTCNHKKGEDYV